MYTTCTDIMYMCWVCVWKLLAILIVHLYISVASTSPSSCRRIVGTIPLVGPVDDDGASPGEGGSLRLYKRMAMAQCKQEEVHRPLHTPGASPGEGGSIIQMHGHGTPCKQQEV